MSSGQAWFSEREEELMTTTDTSFHAPIDPVERAMCAELYRRAAEHHAARRSLHACNLYLELYALTLQPAPSFAELATSVSAEYRPTFCDVCGAHAATVDGVCRGCFDLEIDVVLDSEL